MTIEDKSLTSLNHEFKDNESINNIECEIGVLDFWNEYEKRKPSRVCGLAFIQ